jgi:D-alanine-D-alanine ligase
MTGYARIDVRLKPDGSVYVLEANSNPNLEKEEDFAISAQAGGIGYERLLERIMRSGMGYEAAWRQT